MVASGKRVLIIAGEASGDLYGGNLVKAIRTVDPSIYFLGVGGSHMKEAGVRLLRHAEEMAVVGLPGAKRLLTIFEAFREVSASLTHWRPDLTILIDYPEFNLMVAGRAKRHGIPVMYYVSPQIWAWRSGRINTIRSRVDRMVVILPFEEKLYQEAGVKVSFVGHPLLDLIALEDEEGSPCRRYGKNGSSQLIGLLPGSRSSEVSRLLPVMLDMAAILLDMIPKVHFLVPLAPTISREQIAPYLKGRNLPLTVVTDSTHEVIRACEMIVAASGTVTLEAAIIGTPLVVVYKVNPLTYWLGKRLVKVNHVALANIIAGETVAPELIQHEVTPERIARESMKILNDHGRKEWIKRRLQDVREELGTPGASDKAAAIALELMGWG
ncbi:MAG: lipid-A-disaccharide synthase [Syntrophobacteria bacterium]